jgi:sodium-dependent dicarboxylate transporter 2/3/5
VLFPPLGIASVDTTARAYAHPLIFLFLGGFMMARAMQRWNLNRRVAMAILRLCSDRPSGIIAGVMIATAFLSMWVSNTATAMMMLPIGQAIIAMVARAGRDAKPADVATFATALMLGIAYAATIGGMATLIGTPPNALFAGFMEEAFTMEISFLGWMLVGVPTTVVLLPLAWLVLTRIAFTLSPALPALKDARIETRIGELGPMGSGERRVAILLAIAAAGWVFRPLIQAAAPELALSDAGIAVTVTMMLFITPSDRGYGFFLHFWKNESWKQAAGTDEFLLTWDEAKEIRWDVLILFGGGLALANMIGATGLAAWIAQSAAALGALPWLLLILVVATVIVLLGELASNTAMAAVFLPVAAAAALGLGIHPGLLAMTVALSASLGFMLPVATPPNAIVYGSGAVPARDMVRAGAILDAAGVAVVALVALTIGRWLFGG